MAKIQRIAPCLWFDNQAEEAAKFYVGIFKKSKIVAVTRYSEAGYEVHRRPAGSVLTVAFELEGQRHYPHAQRVLFAGDLRNDGCGAGTSPATHTGRDEDHVGPD